MEKIRIFVSSVQRELENERIAVSETIALDSFLERNISAVLFEDLPASHKSAENAYLDALRQCEIYIGILGFEYGIKGKDGLSATHREYREAVRLKMPTYFFIKGDVAQDKKRDADLAAFFTEVKDKHVYKRFTHYQNLRKHIRDILLLLLEKQGLQPTTTEDESASQTIAQVSDFDSRLSERFDESFLDQDLCRKYVSAVLKREARSLEKKDIISALNNRGLIWHDDTVNLFRPTHAGILLFGKQPEMAFPQARIAANAYGGKVRGEPIDRDDIREPIPRAIERALHFLIRNMRHTLRIEGFSKVQIDEYHYGALREAVVNAVAHRDYDLAGSCIRIEKYEDRIEITSPGLPPGPITLDKIRKLKYIACSRNPNLARGLSYFERIEEQGDGLRRMVRETVEIGLPRPTFHYVDGHFKIILNAPSDIQEIKSQNARPLFEIPSPVLNSLSSTQKSILKVLLSNDNVRVLMLAEKIDVSRQAIQKALMPLIDSGVVIKSGKARDTVYRLAESDNK